MEASPWQPRSGSVEGDSASHLCNRYNFFNLHLQISFLRLILNKLPNHKIWCFQASSNTIEITKVSNYVYKHNNICYSFLHQRLFYSQWSSLPDDSILIKVASPSLGPEWLLEADDDRGDSVSVPHGTENLVGKPTNRQTNINTIFMWRQTSDT